MMSSVRKSRAVRIALVLAAAATAVMGAWWSLGLVPVPETLLSPGSSGLDLLDRHGQPLRAVPKGDRIGRRVAYHELNEWLIQATLVAEDRRFWRHAGVDLRATARAALGWLRTGRIVSGGSTITQQLIKLAEPRPRTLQAKLVEAVQALRLEQLWSKQRILAEYLNRLNYGNLCYGCGEAARYYFGKPLCDLSVAESAFLAGLPQAPSRLNPHRHFERALRRQQWVLRRMHETGVLDTQAYQRAMAEPLRLVSPHRAFHAPHFVDLVLSQPGVEATAASGQVVRTTLDVDLTQTAERVLRSQLRLLRREHVRNGAVVIIDNRSGDVLALVGSEDYFAPDAGQVNGAWARRSAGSTFKPFTYLLAFEQGATAASVVADVPAEFATPTGVFRPVNYDRCYRGPVRYRTALANSLNIPAVRVLESIGGPRVLIERLQLFGLTTLDKSADHYGLGLTIGNAEARLIELVNAYAVLARLGIARPYRLLTDEHLAYGNGRHMNLASGRRVADAGAAWLVADILSDNAARATAFGWDSDLRFDFPVACKTGTSSDFRDNWAIGYTPEFTVGVWLGNFDGTPMERVSGVTGAAPVLHELFAHLHQRFGTTWYTPPDGLVARRIDPITGKCITTNRPNALIEKFLPTAVAPEASPEDYDALGRVRLPEAYRTWASSRHNWLGERILIQDAADNEAPRVVSPVPGSKFYLDPDLPAESQWIKLQAEGGSDLVWESATLELRRGQGGYFARLAEGSHKLTVRQEGTDRRAGTWIQVRQRGSR